MTMRTVAETYHGNRRRETMPDFEAEQFRKAVKKAFEKYSRSTLGWSLEGRSTAPIAISW